MAAASLASRIGSAASEEPTTLEENLSAWMKTKELNLGLDILSDPCISETQIMRMVDEAPKTMVLAALNVVDRRVCVHVAKQNLGSVPYFCFYYSTDPSRPKFLRIRLQQRSRFTPPMLVSAMRSELSVTTIRECITALGQLFDAYAVLPEADIRKVVPDVPSLGNVVLFTQCLLDAKFLDMCLEGSEEGRKALVEAFRVMEVRIRSLEKDSLAGSKAAALLKGLDSVSRSSLAEVSAAGAGGAYDGFFEKRHLDIPGWGPSSTTTATSPRHTKMWVLAGQSKPSPSVGQTLGPLGINMMQFNKELNARIATVRAKVPVQVTLVPKTDKTYAFWLRTPPANWFIRRVARLPLCGGKGHRNIVGTITLKEVYHIARAKSMDPTNVGKPLRSIVISVIGTAHAMGIQVLYKLPVQHQHRDDLPISDLDRLKKETRARSKLMKRGS
ncbi:54S ribosomal protein L11, mitochondrial [Perkinsus olseni]|uniref:54S ribosomal protein L11, mitochondrial n=1 Tax=Perkinsus olseni TaxID=32597 RepID=A0A7J6T7W2_PEROL|nr:54S ribosomal protein L11, mitochondrial [Perkinsus olseni]